MLFGLFASSFAALFPMGVRQRFESRRIRIRMGRPRLCFPTVILAGERLECRRLLTDTTLPVCTLTAPDSGTFNVGQTITLTGTASDDSGQIFGTTYELVKNGSIVDFIYVGSSGLRSSFDWRIPPLSGSGYQIKMVVTDPSGNQGFDLSNGTLTFVPDTTPPTALLTAPNSGNYSVGDTIHMTAVGSDNDSIVSTTYTLCQNGAQVAYLDSTATYTPSYDWVIPAKLGNVAVAGAYQIRVEFGDPSVNKAADFSDGNINIGGGDTTPPVVTLTAPNSGTFAVGQTVTLSGTASDANGIDRTSYELWKGNVDVGSIYQGTNGSGLMSNDNWTIPSAISGNTIVTGSDYQIKMIVWDPSGNSNFDFSNSNLTITGGTNSTPTVTLISPNSGTFAVGQTMTITGTASASGGIDRTYYELWEGSTFIGYIYTGANGSGLKSSYSWVVPATLNGNTLNATDYRLRMEVWDPSGNNANVFSSGNIAITAGTDTTAPTVALTAPNSGTFTVGQTINISGTASDAGGISRTSYELWQDNSFVGVIYQGIAGSGLRSTYSWLVPAVLNGLTLNGGDYQVKMIVWDLSNNVSADYSTSNLTILPSGTTTLVSLIQSSVVSSVTNATSITYTATFSQSVTGVDISDFVIGKNGTIVVASNGLSVSGSGSVYTITISGISGDGSLWLSLINNGSIHNLSNGVLSTFNSTSTFSAAQSVSTGTLPRSVAVGDLNRDGHEDLVIANTSSNTISVLLGNGNGSFAAAKTFSTGTSPYSVAIADFNGDGRPDLAVTNFGNNTISVFIGNGDGTFGTARTFATGSSPYSVCVGDINSDGREDLVVANYASNSVSVLLGNGLGMFAPATNFTVGINPVNVKVADLNNDGHADLVVANYSSNSVSVLLGTGSGTFSTTQSFATGTNPISLAIGDVNGDGRVDLAVANYGSNSVSLLVGNGNGTFAAAKNFATGTNPYSVDFGDIDGNGRLDLAVANYGGGTVSLLLGNGAGSFTTVQTIVTGIHSEFVVLDDLTGDRRLDVIVANSGSNTLSILLASGNDSTQSIVFDHTHPTAIWSQTVTPTKTAADAAIITFSEAVQNVTLANFSLNGTNLGTLAGIKLTAINGNVYVISGLSAYDAAAATYTVAVISGNTIKDLAGNALSGTPKESWTKSATAAVATSVLKPVVKSEKRVSLAITTRNH